VTEKDIFDDICDEHRQVIVLREISSMIFVMSTEQGSGC